MTRPEEPAPRSSGDKVTGRVLGMAREGSPTGAPTRDARTLAVVVSDIVGSTAMRTKMGEAAFTTLREAHDGLGADLVEECGGRVVRFTGDGLLVAFPSAGQALEYASMLAPGVEQLGDEHGRLARTSRDGVSGGHAGVLEDYADVAEGFLALGAVTGEGVWLDFAGPTRRSR